jgi:hypothetical protein
MCELLEHGGNNHGFLGRLGGASVITGDEGPSDAKGSIFALRLFAGLSFFSWLFVLEWNGGRALSNGLFAILNGMPYLFVLLHRKRWCAQAIGIAFGFSMSGGALALFLKMMAWEDNQQGPLIALLFMNGLLFATSVVVWISERDKLRTVVVILCALCGLFYVPFLFLI